MSKIKIKVRISKDQYISHCLEKSVLNNVIRVANWAHKSLEWDDLSDFNKKLIVKLYFESFIFTKYSWEEENVENTEEIN